jgi:hypothetical protein
VANAPSTWRRLATAAAFERIMGTELITGSTAPKGDLHQTFSG